MGTTCTICMLAMNSIVDVNNRVSLSSITDLNDSAVDSVALMYNNDKNSIHINAAFKTQTITISLIK